MKLIQAFDYQAKELLGFDQAAIKELFPSYTTILNDRFNELMVYFEQVNQARKHPGFTFLYHLNRISQ